MDSSVKQKQYKIPTVEKKHNEDARERLVQNAISGNRDALQELCKSVAQDILFSTSRILNNRSDAEDAAQEVLIRLCMNINGLNEPKAFTAWLGRIITNETRRVMLKNKKHDNVVNIADYIEQVEEEKEEFLPQEFTLRQEDRVFVIGIVDRLPERQREAITLHYFNGLSVTETADAMEVKHQVVSRYLKLAREKIKEEIRSHESGSLVSARGMAFLPLGALMSHAMQQEAESIALSNTAWVQQALSNCSTLAAGKAAVAGAVSTGTAGFAKTVASIVIAATVITGALVGFTIYNNRKTPQMEEIVTVGYSVMFSGGNAGATQINPTLATAHAGTNMGDMFARHWWISPTGSDLVIYSGEGGVVEEELVLLRSSGSEGEFMLSFRMEDAAGHAYTLSREFSIKR